MHKILFVFLILGFNNCFAQVYDNDLELLNLKGDVKYIFYDKIYFHHNQIFDSDFSIIGHEYYMQFDGNKNLIKHGSIKEYNSNILTMYPEQKNNNKPKPNYNINGEIIDVKDYYNKGYYKNYLKSNEVFDYRYDTDINDKFIFSVIKYESSIDTTDLGYEYINNYPNEFSEKEHTRYNYYRHSIKTFNFKKELIQVIYFEPPYINHNSYGFMNKIEFSYNSNGDVIKRIEKRHECHPRVVTYEYEYDSNKNWIKKTIICDDCTEEKDRIIDVITRTIDYK